MKTTLYLMITSLLIFGTGCENETPNAELVGTWHLKQVYADPGDGSGEYRPVDSDLYVKFFDSGLFISTEPICNGSEKQGSYDTQTVFVKGCDFDFGYQIIEDKLYIVPPCIEGCGLMFEKE